MSINQAWHDRLTELANIEQGDNHRLAELQAKRDALYAKHIADLDAEIEDLSVGIQERRAEFKEQILAYSAISGDTTIHNLITYQKRSSLKYDANEALSYAQDNAPEYVRRSLDKRKFDKALRDGSLSGFSFELCEVPTIAIQKIDHLALVTEVS